MHEIKMTEADIIFSNGIPEDLDRKKIFVTDDNELNNFPKRERQSHKGTFGTALIVAGSKAFGGAPILCAEAAFATGVGMVKVFTHADNRTALLARLPEVIPICYTDDNLTEMLGVLIEEIKKADSVTVGPGLSTDDNARRITETVFINCKERLVADADALNIISENKESFNINTSGMKIFTPHIKEAARLLGKSAQEIAKNKSEALNELVTGYGVTAVLKDAFTFIGDGCELIINTAGNSGMATAGSGDVLCGILAGLAARGLEGINLATLGVYLHARAGDFAAERFGENSMKASDIVKALPDVIKCTKL